MSKPKKRDYRQIGDSVISGGAGGALIGSMIGATGAWVGAIFGAIFCGLSASRESK